MKKRKFDLHKFNIVLLTLIVISAIAMGLTQVNLHRELQEYNEAGGEIVVIFNEEITEQELQNLTGEYGDKLALVRHIEDYALLSVSDSVHYNEIIASLKQNPLVAEVQGNIEVSTLGFSNDTYADSQWSIDNPGHYIYLSEAGKLDRPSVEGVDMDVVEAWGELAKATTEQHEVVVAVIDTGVDYTHPDLVDHMWVNEGEIEGDNIDNDNNGYIDDIYGWDFYNDDASICHYRYSETYNKNIASSEDNDDHGTHVAGIISATYNNGIGVAGVASNVNVKIMSLKINGGSKGTGSLAGAVEAVKYATMMGADVCNLSWGTSQYTASLKQVMKESDMLFVAAAGNTGDDNNFNPIYPAGLKLDNLISVTFIDSAGELTNLSNYGAETVDIAAPGEDIFSTVVGSYGSMSGSSMAAPQVTAVAAILYACSDHIYAANVKEVILNNTKALPGLEGYLRNGGIPSAYRALLAVSSLTKDLEAPVMSFETIYNKGDMVIPVSVIDQGASKVRVVKWSLGEKTVEDFGRGVYGTAIEDNQINVSKAGKYTFYASDYAGNEAVQTYEVVEDTTAPKITPTYTVADSYKSRTITVRVSDPQSGVKRLEYMSGSRTVEEFLPADAGTEVEINVGKAEFKVKKDGTYSIFIIDNRGNATVKQITIKTIKSTSLKLARIEKTMYVGDHYTLRAFTTPSASTDRVTFTSSDEKIATISSSGRILAHAKGKITISIRTSSGLTATCNIIIVAKSSG